MITSICYVVLPLVFPAGVSPGEDSAGNKLSISRDGEGKLVLRGTAIAGALRQAWRERIPFSENLIESIFGASCDDHDVMMNPSALEAPDCRIVCGKADVLTRNHNHINRHTGAVLSKALFSVQAVPPGATANLVLWLRVDDTNGPADPVSTLAKIAGIFRQGLILGGRSNRGIGLACLDDRGSVKHRCYRLGDIEDHAAYLNTHRAWRGGVSPTDGSDLEISKIPAHLLVVDMQLTIPSGQDLLISSGSRDARDTEIQTVLAADGKEYWLLPGSSLRGVMRAWISRLAARDRKPVAFSVDRYSDSTMPGGKPITGDDVGWNFIESDKRQSGSGAAKEVKCPVAALFGSLAKRGRIHITDALSKDPAKSNQKQTRRHVAIDRVTGGATEGMLSSNEVLIGGSDRPVFTVRMLITKDAVANEDRWADEVRWLAQTLHAINIGLVRVGSSKSAGRLCLAQRVNVSCSEKYNEYAERFRAIVPFEEAQSGETARTL